MTSTVCFKVLLCPVIRWRMFDFSVEGLVLISELAISFIRCSFDWVLCMVDHYFPGSVGDAETHRKHLLRVSHVRALCRCRRKARWGKGPQRCRSSELCRRGPTPWTWAVCLSNNSDLDRVEGAEVMKDTAFHAGTALSISIYCGAQHLKTTNTSCLTQVLKARNLGVAQLAKI